MKRETKSLWLYLLLVAAFWAFTFVTLNIWLRPCAAAYAQSGEVTAGYVLYALIGLVFSTPAPFLSALLLALRREKIGWRAFWGRLVRAEDSGRAVLLTAGFCLAALVFALWRGTPNGSPWYMLPAGFLVMIPFVGVAEEAGWRGFLQPELEKRMKFPFSVLTTAAVWDVWHLDQWLDPASNHYGDSFLGFSIHLLVWAFALAALYRQTGSVMVCAVYHAFVNALGAVYDWNALFDPFPGDACTNLYRAAVLTVSVVLWLDADRRAKGRAVPDKEETVSKYDALWAHIQKSGMPQLTLTFDEIGQIAGAPLDHSFLRYKKELMAYGYEVGKISMKARTVVFIKKKTAAEAAAAGRE